MGALVVLCAVPDQDVATAIARTLVEERLAACVNCVPGVTSIYRWKGELQVEGELLLVIKTTRERYEAASARIVALHPYELPEVIAVDVSHGLDRYLAWVERETRPDAGVPADA